jgi:hypothetical protein
MDGGNMVGEVNLRKIDVSIMRQGVETQMKRRGHINADLIEGLLQQIEIRDREIEANANDRPTIPIRGSVS